jgi:hypothetical protein
VYTISIKMSSNCNCAYCGQNGCRGCRGAAGAPPLMRVCRPVPAPEEGDERRDALIAAINAWLAWKGAVAHGIRGLTSLPDVGLMRDGLFPDIINAWRGELYARPMHAIVRVQQLIDALLEALVQGKILVFYIKDQWSCFSLWTPVKDANLVLDLLRNVCCPGYPTQLDLEGEVIDLLLRLYDGHLITSIAEGAGGGLAIKSEPVRVSSIHEFIERFTHRLQRMNADDEHDEDVEYEEGMALPISALGTLSGNE